MKQFRARLEQVLSGGLANDPVAHAEQVAKIAGILHDAFEAAGFNCTLVGGAAMEIHAPGIHRSGDLDVIIERLVNSRGEKDQIFQSLGLTPKGRHWVKGTLFIETPPSPVAGPVEEVRIADSVFRIVKKEVILRDRVVGFKQWNETGYGAQAIEMLAAFGDQIDMSWLGPELEREDSLDAYFALCELLEQGSKVTTDVLNDVLLKLTSRGNHI